MKAADMLWRSFRILWFCLWLAAIASAQTATKPSALTAPATTASAPRPPKQSDLHLTRVTTITAPAEMATGFLAPLRCDSSGNIYFRTDATDSIHKLNQKGEQVAVFDAAANTDKKVDASASFALAPNGDLYEIVFPHEIDRYLFVYKSDGSFKSATKLDPGFRWSPHALAFFPSGQLLIAGYEYDLDRAAATWPFTGIFGAEGGLLKEIKLEDDQTLREMASSGDARVSLPLYPQFNRAIDLTQIEMAADGNAYLMRWTNPAIVYAISPGGETVRRLKIDPGNSGYRPSDMHVFENRIAILFVDAESHDGIMKIIDLEGHEIAAYGEQRVNNKPNGMLGGAFACYTENPTRFVFLGASDENKLQFWIVEPR